MLTITRRSGESIRVGNGPNMVTIKVVGIGRGKVVLGIEADKSIPIYRTEIAPPLNDHVSPYEELD